MAEIRFAKLKGRIVEKYGSQARFSEAVGLSMSSLSKKLGGRTAFNSFDIIKWCELLEIERDDIGIYFFSR